MNKNLQQGIILVATFATITVNALANILPFNGITTGEVSDQFQTFFVPAGYVFSIWGVIYLLLVVFSFGYRKTVPAGKTYINEVFPLYIFSAVLNSVWIALWHYGYFLTTGVVMVTLLVTLAMIYRILQQQKTSTVAEKLVVHLPFWVYLAWISVATIANVSDILWLLNWNGFGIAPVVWAAIMIIVAGALAVYVTLTTVDFAFALVVIWAVIGIVVRFQQETAILYAGVGVTAILALTWGYRRFRELAAKKKV